VAYTPVGLGGAFAEGRFVGVVAPAALLILMGATRAQPNPLGIAPLYPAGGVPDDYSIVNPLALIIGAQRSVSARIR
jgi:hypothetical protein